MDEADKKILDLLKENGRISYVELAEKVGLSRVAVRDRVNNLIKKGIIEKFSIVINSEKYGKKVSAFFQVECEPYHLESVATSLAENPNVASIYQMTGPSTLHMHVLVEDFSSLEKFINEQLYSVKGINRVESHIILKRYKSRNGLKL